MEQHTKASSSAFWKAYFSKFRRPVEEHEVSETLRAPLSAEPSADSTPTDTRLRRRERISLQRQTTQPKVD